LHLASDPHRGLRDLRRHDNAGAASRQGDAPRGTDEWQYPGRREAIVKTAAEALEATARAAPRVRRLFDQLKAEATEASLPDPWIDYLHALRRRRLLYLDADVVIIGLDPEKDESGTCSSPACRTALLTSSVTAIRGPSDRPLSTGGGMASSRAAQASWPALWSTGSSTSLRRIGPSLRRSFLLSVCRRWVS
jgi:hypothetical protein